MNKRPKPDPTPRTTHGGKNWTTLDELDFLEGLGTFHSPTVRQIMPNHRTLLLRYRAAMSLRRDWGRINLGVIRNSLLDMLGESS